MKGSYLMMIFESILRIKKIKKETHGEMKSIETAENCTNLAGRD